MFRLVTGVPLNADQRVDAAVDLAGLGVRVFGQGQFDDQEVDNAVTIIKDALSGNLTSGSLSKILGFGNYLGTRESAGGEKQAARSSLYAILIGNTEPKG